jgi:hypothetical protein
MKNEDMAKAVYDQTLEKWVHPEIYARHERGEIAELPFKLHSAQVVLGLDGSYSVRLNGEVKGTFKGRAFRTIKKGQALTYQDVTDLYFSEQAPEDREFGHITLVSSGDDKWSVNFSFIYGTEKIEKYLQIGGEFLDQSSAALKDSSRTAMALGMTAAENLIKARLAASPIVDIKTKTHNQLRQLYNRFVLRNPAKKIDKDYGDAYKFFAKHFNKVRYDPEAKSPHRATIKKHLRTLGRLQAETQQMVDQVEMISMASRQVEVKKGNPLGEKVNSSRSKKG